MAYTDIVKNAKIAGEIESASTEIARRRARFTLPELDRRFLKFFIASYGCGAIAIIMLFATMALCDMLFSGEDAAMATRDVLDQGWQFWLLLSAGMIIQVSITLSFVTRFSGMMVPFRRTLDTVVDGKVPSYIKLREGDFLTDEAHLVNAAIFRLNEIVDGSKKQQDELVRLREELRAEGLEEYAQAVEFLLDESEPCDEAVAKPLVPIA